MLLIVTRELVLWILSLSFLMRFSLLKGECQCSTDIGWSVQDHKDRCDDIRYFQPSTERLRGKSLVWLRLVVSDDFTLILACRSVNSKVNLLLPSIICITKEAVLSSRSERRGGFTSGSEEIAHPALLSPQVWHQDSPKGEEVPLPALRLSLDGGGLHTWLRKFRLWDWDGCCLLYGAL